MKKQFGEYYLGLDIGTDSIGWAVTDLEYNIQKLNGKALWGIRLFEAGKTAEDRRLHRSARRRRQRQIQRLDLLQNLFKTEISKIDPGFYLRMEESKFYPDDKKINQINSLFNDEEYDDKCYFKEFPTIYHLRKALIEDKKEYDSRLVYLAIHHILKYRGHFLFEGRDIQNIGDVKPLFEKLNEYLLDEYESEFVINSLDMVEDVLKSKTIKKRDKKNKLFEILFAEDKQQQTIVETISGYKTKLSDLFCEEEFVSSELNKICFSDGSFDEKKDDISDLLEDRMYLLDLLKAIYDWGILAEIMQGHEYISFAKVAIFDKHKNDLCLLKNVLRKCDKDKYDLVFKSHKEPNNYCAYSARKSSTKEELSKKCTQETFCAFISKVLENIKVVDENLEYLKAEAENKTLMPKQVSKDNSVIPYQIHLHDLKEILENASRYLEFLNDEDAAGLTVRDKIISIMEYRIPYYVGPINDYHKDAGFCWIEKKSNNKIYPWNFKEIVDEEKSAENFIMRMTNKCTYLNNADVLPKNSLLYSEFQVLNEINNIRINDDPISAELKMEIFNNLFKKQKKVTSKKLRTYLLSRGYIENSTVIKGLDEEIKSSLSSYLDLFKIIGEEAFDTDMAEVMVKWITLFGDSRKMLIEKISKEYGYVLNDEQIKTISNLRYGGWGRLSKELLCDIYDINKDTGEFVNIITLMRETNENLMQLLSSKYGFTEKIAVYNAKESKQSNIISYESVEDLRLSPAVKRGIWQSLLIVQEIVKVMQHEPKKVFIEFAREEGNKKRTKSRKETLKELYKSCNDQYADLVDDLESKSDADLRGDRLYLYYTQMGRCMYTGEEIDLDTLLKDSDKNIYDIDHIYPRSKIKDDSIENRVLVKKTANMIKGDEYPLPSRFMQQKALWNVLYQHKLIGEKKYSRLISRDSLTEDDLGDFIERQLVETRQSTKAFAEILKNVMPETGIIYVKAGNVSEFRNKFELVKIRDINDLHHAKDAYLNIVVGNVYDVKFTRNPRNFIKKSDSHYNLRTLFEKDVKTANCMAWNAGDNGTITKIKNVIDKNNILFTRYSFEYKGEISDQQIMKKGKGQLPIKSSDKRLQDISRYGGYNKVSTAYFVLVEHQKGKKVIKSIEYVPVHMAKYIQNDISKMVEYCKNDLKLNNPIIKIPKIKINTLFSYNGFLMHVKARTNETLVLSGAHQLHIPKKYEKYLKDVYKYVDMIKNKKIEEDFASLRFDSNINIEIYDFLRDKLINSVYSIKLKSQMKYLDKGRDIFIGLNIYNQCEALTKIIILFKCVSGTTDLQLIGAGKSVGQITINKDLKSDGNIYIINQSITGIFSKEVNLNEA